jgi:hypothetical protein
MMSKTPLLGRRIGWNSQQAKPIKSIQRSGVDDVKKQDIGLRDFGQRHRNAERFGRTGRKINRNKDS